MTRQSSISTEAGVEESGGGNGGNIFIDTPFITAFDNSDITANAFEGNGGNISITTQGLFGLAFRDVLTAESDITASSEFGLSGTVAITTPDVDPASDAVLLPTSIVDVAQQIDTACRSVADSRFTIGQQVGIPLGPDGSGSGDRPWSVLLPDFGPSPSDDSELALGEYDRENKRPLRSVELSLGEDHLQVWSGLVQEATRMAIAPNGTIQLIPHRSPHGPDVMRTRASCLSSSAVL